MRVTSLNYFNYSMVMVMIMEDGVSKLNEGSWYESQLLFTR